MTAIDHLRAVLATVNEKAFAPQADQEAIERARRFVAAVDAASCDGQCTAIVGDL